MASVLAAQLRAIALAHGGPAPQQSTGRPSLLFSPQEAADIDLPAILSVAETGLAELSEYDRRFEPFSRTLFGQQSLQLDREMESPSGNEQLDASISAFMGLLSPYLLLTPAHQVLEYLIRRYRVQVYNVEAVMRASLPYHETNLFVRLVQLLHIQGTKWQFLEGVQRAGATVPRGLLAQRCCRDFALMETICEMVKEASGASENKGHPALTFWGALVLEALKAVPVVSTDLISRLLPYLLHGFHKRAVKEYTAAVLMIISQLANRATLSAALLDTLFEALAKPGGSPALIKEKVMAMLQLAQTQPMTSFPGKAFNYFVKIRDLPAILANLARCFSAANFFALFLKALVQHSATHANYEELLVRCIWGMPLSEHVASLVMELLHLRFGRASAEAKEEAKKGWKCDVATRLLRELAKCYPEELRGARKHLQEAAKSAECSEEQQTRDQPLLEEEIAAFFKEALHGTLLDSLPYGQTSPFLGIGHPQASVRRAAVAKISEVCKGATDEEFQQLAPIARKVLVCRLEDKDWGVVMALMGVAKISNLVPGKQLLRGLEKIAGAAILATGTGQKRMSAAPRAALKALLELLATGFMPRHPGLAGRASRIFLAFLLLLPKSRKLSVAALRLAAAAPFQLFGGLPEVARGLEDAGGDAPLDATGQTQRLREDAELNRKIVAALAHSVISDKDCYAAVFGEVEAVGGEVGHRARFLTILILIRSLGVASEGRLLMLLIDALPRLKRHWATLQRLRVFRETPFGEADFVMWEKAGFLPRDHIIADFVGGKSAIAYVRLVQTAIDLYCRRLVANSSLFAEDDGVRLGLVKEAFVMMGGSLKPEVFSRNIALVLEGGLGLSNAANFLSNFFAADEAEVGAGLQEESLKNLVNYTRVANLQYVDYKKANPPPSNAKTAVPPLQALLPPLLAALSSPPRMVRRAAVFCIKHIARIAAETHTADPGFSPRILGDEDFLLLCDLVSDNADALVGATPKLAALLGEVLSLAAPEQAPEWQLPARRRMIAVAREAIAVFLAAHAITQKNDHAKVVLLSSLTGVGHTVARAEATLEGLKEMLEVRREQHLRRGGERGAESPRDPLSAKGLAALKLLLALFDTWVAVRCAVRRDLAATFVAALEVDGGESDDPVVVETAIAACGCITYDFYAACGPWMQKELLGALVVMMASGAGKGVQLAAKEALERVQLSSTTIVYLLKLLARDMEAASLAPVVRGEPSSKAAKPMDGEGPAHAADIAGTPAATFQLSGRALPVAPKRVFSLREDSDEYVEESRAATWPPAERALAVGAVLLEVLLWKDEIADRYAVVPALEELLRGGLSAGRICEQPPHTPHLQGHAAGAPPPTEVGLSLCSGEGPGACPFTGGGGEHPPARQRREEHAGAPPAADGGQSVTQSQVPGTSSWGGRAQEHPLAEQHVEGQVAGAPLATEADPLQASDKVLAGGSVAGSYVQQLILMVLAKLAKSSAEASMKLGGGWGSYGSPRPRFDAELAVLCVSMAADEVARKRATSFLTALSAAQPGDVLHQVLRLLSSLGSSMLTLDDNHSHRLALQLLAAVVPAWLSQPGHDLCQLLQVVVDVLPTMPPLRRLTLGSAIIESTTEAKGLPVMLESLLKAEREVTACREEQSSPGAPAGGNKEQPVLNLPWIREYCEQLLARYPMRVRLASFAALLERMWPHGSLLKEVNDTAEPSWKLRRAAADFVAAQLRAMPSFDARGSSQMEDEEAVVAQGAYTALLRQVVPQLRAPPGVAALGLEQNAATEASYRLLTVLDNLMAPATYLQGMASLLSYRDTLVQCEVLRLLTARAQEESKVVAKSRRPWQWPGRQMGARGSKVTVRAAVERRLKAEESGQYAALAERIAGLLSEPEEDMSDTTKLAALQALEVFACKCAANCPEGLQPTLLTVLSSLHNTNQNQRVAGAAVHLVATLVAALGPALLPHLARTVAVLLRSSAAAVCRAAPQPPQAQAAAMEVEGAQRGVMDGGGWGPDAGAARARGHEGCQLVEQALAFLQEVLTAWEQILQSLGAFLSPYLREILELALLLPGLWAGDAGAAPVWAAAAAAPGVMSRAAAIQKLLPQKIPARLLLDPLLGLFDKALQEGAPSAAALLRILDVLVARLDRTSMALYRGRIFEFLLAAMDVRRRQREAWAGAGGIVQVEAAVVTSMAALSLKLSESLFRPLFVRIVDWATDGNVDGQLTAQGGGSTERHVALFGLVNVLLEKLRPIMVPYFHYLVDPSILLLTGHHASEVVNRVEPEGRRKRRRTAAPEAEGATPLPPPPALTVAQWQLRYLVVAALHKCFLHDTAALLNLPRFQLLVEPLISQIECLPPPGVPEGGGGQEDLDGGDSYPAASVPSAKRMADAVVACLRQLVLVLAASSEQPQRPLVYQVLIRTRNEHPRIRALALGVVRLLVDTLKENFLVAVPEGMTFLYDVLHDRNAAIVAEAWKLIGVLDELDGEELVND